ncbi:MAG: cytochrome c oxidase subunit II, partial [Bacteroidetes bacterium]
MNNGSAWLPEQASTLAPEIDALFYFVKWVSLIIFVGVVAAMLYFMFKYRRRDAAERPVPVKESKLIEISWVVVPTILVLIVFVWGFQGFIKLNVAPPEAYQITVRAKKWLWEFEYPNGTTTVGEVHVPVGRP